jgi:hypothetical protein
MFCLVLLLPFVRDLVTHTQLVDLAYALLDCNAQKNTTFSDTLAWTTRITQTSDPLYACLSRGTIVSVSSNATLDAGILLQCQQWITLSGFESIVQCVPTHTCPAPLPPIVWTDTSAYTNVSEATQARQMVQGSILLYMSVVLSMCMGILTCLFAWQAGVVKRARAHTRHLREYAYPFLYNEIDVRPSTTFHIPYDLTMDEWKRFRTPYPRLSPTTSHECMSNEEDDTHALILPPDTLAPLPEL